MKKQLHEERRQRPAWGAAVGFARTALMLPSFDKNDLVVLWGIPHPFSVHEIWTELKFTIPSPTSRVVIWLRLE